MKSFDIKQAQQHEQDWENSRDGIYQNLEDRLFGSEKMERAVVATLQKLPREVRAFVYKNCAFVDVGPNGGWAIFMAKNRRFKWLLLFGSSIRQSTIAHEIAHAWLGHAYPLSANPVDVGIPNEIGAWTAVKRWGWHVQAEIDRHQKLLDEHRRHT